MSTGRGDKRGGPRRSEADRDRRGGDDDDLYQILGVPPDADESTIKKAYRKLAMRWHPDKNRENQTEATRRFNEISEAYQTLSDPSKRQRYDRGGDPSGSFDDDRWAGRDPFGGGFSSHMHMHDNFFSSRGPSFQDPFELFRSFFGDDPFGHMHGGGGGGGGGGYRHSTSQTAAFGGGGGGMMSSFFGGGSAFGGGDPFGGMMMGGNFESFSSASGGGMGHFESVQTSTTIQNGKQITHTTVTKNGKTTTKREERDARTGALLSSTSSESTPRLESSSSSTRRLEARR